MTFTWFTVLVILALIWFQCSSYKVSCYCYRSIGDLCKCWPYHWSSWCNFWQGETFNHWNRFHLHSIRLLTVYGEIFYSAHVFLCPHVVQISCYNVVLRSLPAFQQCVWEAKQDNLGYACITHGYCQFMTLKNTIAARYTYSSWTLPIYIHPCQSWKAAPMDRRVSHTEFISWAALFTIESCRDEDTVLFDTSFSDMM